jgi:hypothetical protein
LSTPVVVVDTNVPVVANLGHAAASPACIEKCVQAVVEITDGRRRLALDDSWLIIKEYQHNLPLTGQLGVGGAFLKWVLTNHANPERCDKVAIKPIEDRGFEEFPDHPGLAAFDRADRKFVAVAAAHPGRPPIQQAVDSKWWGYRDALQEAGVVVDFLCPEEVGGEAAPIPPRPRRRRG